MVPDRANPSLAPPSRLDERILTTLQDLHGHIAFNGLRRALGAHPESLSRALRRLEREGLVERVDGGYRALAIDAVPPTDLSETLRPIARVDLPPGALPETVLARLAGHWFGALRWVGVVERPSGRLLIWARRDGTSQVLVGIQRGVLRVYVPEGSGGNVDLSEAEDAAYELLVHAVDALRPPTGDRLGALTFLRSPYLPRPPWSVENY